jgi:hypothetical protein
MSGGYFDYNQHKINYIIEELNDFIGDKQKIKEYKISLETLKEFNNAIDILKKASIYTQRIDWFLSGDDGQENFHKRLKEDLTNNI